jgi:hypothetical protein
MDDVQIFPEEPPEAALEDYDLGLPTTAHACQVPVFCSLEGSVNEERELAGDR